MKTAALVFGVTFLLIGALGFVPALTPNNMLLGIFHVNEFHNIVHIASGVIALLCATRVSAARIYFQVFGIVYGLVAILGLFVGHDYIMGVLANNMADVILHFAIAAVSLYMGLIYQERPRQQTRAGTAPGRV
jgi:hypothetical protein